MTFTVTVPPEAPTASFAPVPPTVKVPAPATAVMVGAPPQPFTTPGAAASTTPAGNVSVKVRLVRAGDPTGLVMVKVRTELWPTPTVVGANAWVSAGNGCRARQLEVTELVTRASAPRLPAALVWVAGDAPQFVFVVVAVTSTVITHDACAALIDAPATVMLPLPAAAVTTPVPEGQVVVMLGAAATVMADGSVSVKSMPDCAGLPAPLVSVKVSVDVAPVSMVAGANALFTEACATFSVRFAVPPVSATGPVAVTVPLVLL